MRRLLKRDVDAAIGRIETAEILDDPGYAIGKAISRAGQLGGRPAKALANALHGTPYGHPVHPLVVALPIGMWTLALALDLLAATGVGRGRDSGRAADLALKAGSLGALAAIATGLADWNQLNGRDRRVGLFHGAVNGTALALNLASIRLRGRDRPAAGRWFSGVAYAFMSVGGYLGGHLVYRRRAGVDHADRSPEPRDFVPVVALAELQEQQPRRVAIRDDLAHQEVGVVLVRQGDVVHAMGAKCSHQGGPLDQGWVQDGALVCPWHGSRYDLATGAPVVGPSTCPQPRYQTRVRDGIVELRREQEPGDHIVTSETLAREAPAPAQVEGGPRGRLATDVLLEHHQLIRRLFDRIEAMPRTDPQRHQLLHTLASELEIHEHIEDACFYPAVRPVSEDVDVAHSEHAALADQMAMTLKAGTSSPTFEIELEALHAALLHHAGSEETSMFVQAQRLGEARLREIGHALETMMEHQRTSRFQRAFMALKVSLLETV